MREEWIEIIYKDLVRKVSTTKQKIKQKDYLQKGKIPIVDQGQESIGGYTDDESKILDCSLPVIVFGDHTKAVKLVNFQFAPGADGTKVLEPKEMVLPIFLSYVTQYLVLKIKDKGYARHYQYIEKEKIYLPSLIEQRAIVSKIEELFSKLDNGIENLNKAKEKLEIYRQTVLKKAFEGKLTKEWREKQLNLPSINGLLEQLISEHENLFRERMAEWDKEVIEWEKSGKSIRKPSKPKYSINPEDILKLKSVNDTVCDESWVDIKLDYLGELYCGQSPSVSQVNQEGKGILYVTGPEQWNGKNIEETKWTEFPKRIAPDGSVFITVKGAGVGKLFPGTYCAIGRDIYAFKPIPFINQTYLYYALKHSIDLIIMKAQGDIPGLTKNHILNHYIGLCSKQEQNQIVQEIESRLSVCDNILISIDEGLERSEALRQSILKKALEGKLLNKYELDQCRKEPDWEPAEKLLERIKKMK